MLDLKLVSREILLAFWKIHILHHAAKEGVVGTWMLEELRHHDYEVSAGTLFPILKRMEASGWLVSTSEGSGKRARRTYRITDEGRAVMKLVERQLREIKDELGVPARAKQTHHL